MSRHLAWFFLAVLMLAVSAPLQALNYEVGGCKTGSSYVNFTTISAAVIGVPAGSKIQICPGVYPEQVTITQPLTLQGIAANNASRAVITVPVSASLAPNVGGLFGTFYAQVLVQNVNPAGPVNIIGITVDGAGINLSCDGSEFLAGIFYASGTTGTVNGVTARNNQSSGCGYGVWAENGAAPNQSIVIENSSVHEGGIVTLTDQNPPTLAATIKGNFLTSANQTYVEGYFEGITVAGVNGSVTGNVTTGGYSGITAGNGVYGGGGGTVTISQNTIADLGNGIFLVNSIGVISSNKIWNAQWPFTFVPQTTYPDGPTTIKGNIAMNSFEAVFFAGCPANLTLQGNIFNDAQVAFYRAPSVITGNALYNVDTVQAGSSCN